VRAVQKLWTKRRTMQQETVQSHSRQSNGTPKHKKYVEHKPKSRKNLFHPANIKFFLKTKSGARGRTQKSRAAHVGQEVQCASPDSPISAEGKKELNITKHKEASREPSLKPRDKPRAANRRIRMGDTTRNETKFIENNTKTWEKGRCNSREAEDP